MATIATNLPIFWLTLRQFTAGRSTRIVALFALTPVIFGLIYTLNPEGTDGASFLAGIFLEFLAPTVIPIATLILATGALGNEIADRTLPYLVLKPIGRWRIVVEKFAGVAAVTMAAFAIGVAGTWLIVELAGDAGGFRALLALEVATLAAIAAYGALFLCVSLIVPRALVVGIVYILLWESLLARFIPGVRILSIRHFTQSLFVEIYPDVGLTLDEANRASTSLIVLIVIVVAALIIGTLQLRRMNLD